MVIALRHFAVSSIPLTFFTFEYLIEFHYNFSQLAWVRFFTGLLSKITPITRLWGHVKTAFYVSVFPSYSGFKGQSEQNCTAPYSASAIGCIQSFLRVSRSILSSIGGFIFWEAA